MTSPPVSSVVRQRINCAPFPIPSPVSFHLSQFGEGVRFANHYDTTSICMASRSSVMTGLYEYRHGCNFDHGDLERHIFAGTYPVKLRQAAQLLIIT